MEYNMEPKDEYVVELSQALFGKMSQAQINQQVRYYDNYIMEECAKGKTQEQVIEELGAPSVVARTIVTSAEKPAEDTGTRIVEEPSVRTVKVNRENRFAQAAKSHGYDLNDVNETQEVEVEERTYTPDDQYMKNYHGIKAEYSEEKGWEVKAGPFRLNKWYGTGLIAGVILIVWGLIEKFMN
ncbi:HAAS signaling domain-containing protein [Eubacterium oxidoreducens]|uniref:DUF1700 domain-containing protein n=1 Tax=Eubacterium oxidoreducens TaxID=1732 RepID=A0A1G6AB92_EUBOX|nr:hypothetical protein [Eubacterium oxidoreducens]SDB05560.1 hypothetical protein SAMN02910417_00367 [Eubacterium oxidoreducens]